MYFVHFVGHSR